MKSVTIIGAGFSGSMLTAHLAKLAASMAHEIKIALIDGTGVFGRGVAYGTPSDEHLLNVPAARMSAFPDEPEHFLNWLLTRMPEASAQTFAPRRLYGTYLQETFAETVRAAAPHARVDLITDEAIAATVDQNGRAAVVLKSGKTLFSDAVSLALGNLPPAQTTAYFREIEKSERYVANFWADKDHWSRIPSDARILIIGSGLTMVDAALSLAKLGHTGKITVVSRRGLLPRPHQLGPAYPPFIDDATIGSLRSVRRLMRAVRAEVESAKNRGVDWRAVIDSMRGSTQALWNGFSLEEKRRFLRHVRSYWEVLRHRMAPEVARRLQLLIDGGRLELLAARINRIEELDHGFEVELRHKIDQVPARAEFDLIINCIGPECDYRRVEHPLIQNLLQQHLIWPDPLGMGIEVDDDGVVLESSGRRSSVFTAIGPLRKGRLWETTAVPELRVQAQSLAKTIFSLI